MPEIHGNAHLRKQTQEVRFPDPARQRRRRLRSQSNPMPIIMVTAKGEEVDRIVGLEIGADDYMTKPFHMAELSARVNSICRRAQFVGFNEMNFNEITVTINENQAYANGELLNLTRKEYDLLLFFMANHDRIVTKESIVEHLWGDNVILTDSFDFVYTHVKNLRKKLVARNCKNYIRVIYGFGYKFCEQ